MERRPPQLGHCSTSFSKTLRIRSDHGMYGFVRALALLVFRGLDGVKS